MNLNTGRKIAKKKRVSSFKMPEDIDFRNLIISMYLL
jgi:hypothetical protein